MKKIPFHFLDEVFVRAPIYTFRKHIEEKDILQLLDDPFFLEAIYVSSNGLYEKCIKLKNGQIDDPVEKKGIVFSLHRYLSRMTSRSTPFGLFTSCSLSKWGEQTTRNFESGTFHRYSRLDMNLLHRITTYVAGLPELAPQIQYFSNNSVYHVGSEIRYIEYTFLNGYRKHKISGVKSNPYILNILEICKKGLTVPEITEVLAQQIKNPKSVSLLIQNMIQSQLLVNQFEAVLTSEKDYGTQIQEHLEKLAEQSESENVLRIKQSFDRIVRQVRGLNETRSFNEVGAYKDIIAQLEDNFPFEIGKKVFHIDGYRSSAKTTINKKVKKDLLELFAFFNRINAGAYDTKPDIEAFKAKFRARYDTKEVLLINALDRDFGIGYPVDKPSVSGSLVDDLPFNFGTGDLQVSLSKKDQWLLEILQLPENRGKYSIHLDQHTIPFENKNNWEKLPSTISSMFRVLNDEEETILFEFFFGPSGASLPSRFAFGSQEIKDVLKNIVNIEDKRLKNALYAEFTHMSDSKYANVVIHPSFRDYEVPYLAMPGVEEDKQITVDDLYIKLEHNRIVLFSKRLNKEILPCKTHVHNHFSHSLPLYHFLGDLQNAPVNQSMHFSWGNLKQLFYFVPRTYYKNIIISPAEWNLHISVFQGLSKLEDDELFKKVKELRERFNLPQKILHSELDNDLIVDFEDLLSVRSWLKIINSKSLVTMKEFLWILNENPEEPVHLMQYVATLINEQDKQYHDPIPAALVNQKATAIERDFMIGSEWVYFKLYCGINSADYVLLNVLAPIIKNISQADLIKKWFFIKYSDEGGYHLRLRFQLKDRTKIGALYQLFYEGINRSPESQLINKIQSDTYQREVERYGANTIDLCESIFHIDSATTLELLKHFTADEREVFKTIWSLQLINHLLDGFKISLEDKIGFVDLSRKSFQQEFSSNKYTTRNINQKYSIYQEMIKDVMNEAPRFHPLSQLLKGKSIEMNQYIHQIVAIVEKGELSVDYFQLLSSIIHMMLNRFITHKERLHEFLIYDFLFKHYKTKFYLEKVH